MSEEYLDKKVFEQDIKGFLFFGEQTREGTDRLKIIFEYNSPTLRKLREGDIVAVESFSNQTPEGEIGTFYSLLSITRLNPTHITIDRLKKFRFMGAVREFLREATKDFESWATQENIQVAEGEEDSEIGIRVRQSKEKKIAEVVEQKKLDEAMDKIRNKYGKSALKRGQN